MVQGSIDSQLCRNVMVACQSPWIGQSSCSLVHERPSTIYSGRCIKSSSKIMQHLESSLFHSRHSGHECNIAAICMVIANMLRGFGCSCIWYVLQHCCSLNVHTPGSTQSVGTCSRLLSMHMWQLMIKASADSLLHVYLACKCEHSMQLADCYNMRLWQHMPSCSSCYAKCETSNNSSSLNIVFITCRATQSLGRANSAVKYHQVSVGAKCHAQCSLLTCTLMKMKFVTHVCDLSLLHLESES